EVPRDDAEGGGGTLGWERRRVRAHGRQELVVWHDAVDEPHRARLLRAHESPGVEEVAGVRHADQPGQDPRAAVLGDESAAREEEAETGPVRGETEVVVEHVRGPEAGGDAVPGRGTGL